MDNTEEILHDPYFVPLQIEEEQETKNKSAFSISPLNTGFGLTIAELLINTIDLFSSGWSVISILVSSKKQKFDHIPGAQEDLDEILLSFGHIVLTSSAKDDVLGFIHVNKTGTYYLRDVVFEGSSKVKVYSDLDIPLFTIGSLEEEYIITLRCREGVRSVHKSDIPASELYTYSKYSPVSRAEYLISSCLYGQRANYDKIELNVKSVDSTTPRELVEHGIETLIEQFNCIKDEDLFQ